MPLYIHTNGKHKRFFNFFEKGKKIEEEEYVITNKFIEEYNELKETIKDLKKRIERLEEKEK